MKKAQTNKQTNKHAQNIKTLILQVLDFNILTL